MLPSDEIVKRIEARIFYLKVMYSRRESANPRHGSNLKVDITQLEALLEKCKSSPGDKQAELLAGLASLGISILS